VRKKGNWADCCFVFPEGDGSRGSFSSVNLIAVETFDVWSLDGTTLPVGVKFDGNRGPNAVTWELKMQTDKFAS